MFSPSAIADFLACQHLTALNRSEAAGEIERPFFADPGVELLRRLGAEHEQAYFRQFENRGLDIARIPQGIAREDASAQTIEAIRRGAEVIYQPAFFEGLWGGRADFLTRVDKSSGLGAWSYEVVETKLARSTKVRALIQLCFYSTLLSTIQGVEPDWMHVVLGGGRPAEKFPIQRYMAYFRKIRREFEEAYRAGADIYPDPVEHCPICSWSTVCDERRRADDHLSLVAGINGNQRKALIERGVNTVADLGSFPIPAVPRFERIGNQALRNIREQARLQVQGRDERRHIYELLVPVEAERGLCSLPRPSAGDVFLDFEGDPYSYECGLEYLFGVVTLSEEAGAQANYEATWALDRTSEKVAFETFITNMMERRRRHPDMHIFHYGAYEETVIKRMAGQHATCVDAVDELLRAGVLVNLLSVVRQGLRASVESYSIKKLEPLYGYDRDVQLLDANQALSTFQAVLAFGPEEGDVEELCSVIEGYNRDDCLSTLQLRNWLEDRRRELEVATGEDLPRPEANPREPSEDLSAHLERVRALASRLVAGLPEEETEWSTQQRACWLLAQLLEWHRREDKSAWWAYFDRCEMTDEQLQEDKAALGGLVYVGPVEQVKKSIIHRYQFPLQDHAIDRAKTVHDPRTQKGAGEVVAIDERAMTIDLKRAASSAVPHPTALIPYEIVGSAVMRDSLLRIAVSVADNGIDSLGPFQAGRDLLLRLQPRLQQRTVGEVVAQQADLLEAAIHIAPLLDNSVLPIQGPPGSGKTFTGARMILELARNGRRVGVTAVSHKVISKLLEEVCKAAREAGENVPTVQKVDTDDACPDEMVMCVTSNDAVTAKLASGEARVAAGTVWLWSREEMANSVDVLFVDEAGQMSLANVLAASQASQSVVLLGDPQQLDQPQKGVHPPGAGVSALAHLLNGQATIDEGEGLFLNETWRLHPDICAFTSEIFYDSRLEPRAENERQRLNTQGPLDGTGLRVVPVAHSGNQSDSPEEVTRISELIDQLLRSGATWTKKNRDTVDLTINDILIVAPYNAQVSALAQALPQGARVGTVDKFQGQEAPIVFYSMTTSTADDAPRGMEFLYSSNRLNVATSRAQCVTVLVSSPVLFDVQCKTPRQMELTNAFCRYLEIAQLI